MRVAFGTGVDARPHIEPFAAAIVEARKTCFATPPPGNFVARIRVDIRGGVIAATAKNAQSQCFATALDKQPIKDAVDVTAEIQVSVAAP